MAETLPVTFDIPGEGNIVSYDWTDLAEGTGIVVLYGGGLATSGAVSYRLDKNTFDPWHEGASSSGGGSESTGRHKRFEQSKAAADGFINIFDLDFDTAQFNTPRTINGNMLCQIPFASTPYSSAGVPTSYVVVTVRKVTGGVETNLATGTSNTTTYQYIGDGTFSFNIDIPKTNFKKDDILRINVMYYAKNNNGSAESCAYLLCYDPLSRVVAAIDGSGSAFEKVGHSGNTAMKFHVPFRIEL